MSKIIIKDAVKKYGNNTVIPDLNATIRDGELFTLLGPSGCGKTTALKLMNGLLTPEQGTVCINGTDISHTDINELRRGIGYVIQEIGLFPHMTIEKNICYVPNL